MRKSLKTEITQTISFDLMLTLFKFHRYSEVLIP